MENYDFRGWATKNDLKCSDGRTIRRDAFASQDGEIVPLCWGHKHDDVFHVLGHALLKNEPEGVRAYCKFNNTDQGNAAREVVRNGDVNSLSIYAGHLKHNGADVMHGKIVEVSLVLAGANPGAKIEDVFSHGEYTDGDEGVIYTGETLDLDTQEPEISHEDKTEKEESKVAETEKKEKSVQDVIDSMNEEQKTAMAALIGLAIEETQNSKKEEDNPKCQLH